jgi:hypothetical protein
LRRSLRPGQPGIDDGEYEVSVDNDTLPTLLLACRAALAAVEGWMQRRANICIFELDSRQGIC